MQYTCEECRKTYEFNVAVGYSRVYCSPLCEGVAIGRKSVPAVVVYKDGSYKHVKNGDCRTYENDPGWLVTINPERDKP